LPKDKINVLDIREPHRLDKRPNYRLLAQLMPSKTFLSQAQTPSYLRSQGCQVANFKTQKIPTWVNF
jgi:hypothetical protein